MATKVLLSIVGFCFVLLSCTTAPCQILDLNKSCLQGFTLEIQNNLSGSEPLILKNQNDIRQIIQFVDKQWCEAKIEKDQYVWNGPIMSYPAVDGFVSLDLYDNQRDCRWGAWINPYMNPYGLSMEHYVGKLPDELLPCKLLLNKDAWDLYCLLLKIGRKYDSNFELPDPGKNQYEERGGIIRKP